MKNFIVPCFLKGNSINIQNKLLELGYENDRNRSEYYKYVIAIGNKYIGKSYIYSYPFESSFSFEELKSEYDIYDCGKNESLFLALAAINDQDDYLQWFTDGDHWELCLDKKAYLLAWIDKYHTEPHKATKEELIEYFNK